MNPGPRSFFGDGRDGVCDDSKPSPIKAKAKIIGQRGRKTLLIKLEKQNWEDDFIDLLSRPKGNFSNKDKFLVQYVHSLLTAQLDEAIGKMERMIQPLVSSTIEKRKEREHKIELLLSSNIAIKVCIKILEEMKKE